MANQEAPSEVLGQEGNAQQSLGPAFDAQETQRRRCVGLDSTRVPVAFSHGEDCLSMRATRLNQGFDMLPAGPRFDH